MNRAHFALLATIALVSGLVLPFLFQAILGDRPGAGQAPSTTPTIQVGTDGGGSIPVNISLTGDGLIRFSSYVDLYAFIQRVSALNKSVDQLIRAFTEAVPRGEPVLDLGVLTPGAPSQGTTIVQEGFSKTNVQVEGIDELDLVKTDGRVIALSIDKKVHIFDPGTRRVKSVLVFNESIRGVYLYSNKLIVLGESVYQEAFTPDVDCRCFIIPPGHVKHVIYIFDIVDPSNPTLLLRLDTTGALLSSRLRDRFVYFVFNTPIEKGVIPLINTRPVPLETMIAISTSPSDYTMILVIDLEELAYSAYTFLTGGGSWLYMSHDRLYVAREIKPVITDSYLLFINEAIRYLPSAVSEKISRGLGEGDLREAWVTLEEYLYSVEPSKRESIFKKARFAFEEKMGYDSTVFYVFNLNGSVVEYSGSFTVEGELLDQFAMEEYGGYFIVATTVNRYELSIYEIRPLPFITSPVNDSFVIKIETIHGSERTTITMKYETRYSHSGKYSAPKLYIMPIRTGGSSNNVYIVDLAKLTTAGKITGLAPGERIYSARLVGSVFYLVTFRQVDPLFAIDVSDPEDPKVLGFLKIPGFSEYLHPLPGERLLGVGIEDWSTLKISLFDVKNPANMSEIAVLKIQPGWSPALIDHHAVTVHYARELVFLPYSRWSGEDLLGILAITFSESKLELFKLIPHTGSTRAIYIGKELFTISRSSIKIIDLDTLDELMEIPLS